jgi:hypothetical protein
MRDAGNSILLQFVPNRSEVDDAASERKTA